MSTAADAPAVPEVIEEHYLNEPTGVEAENNPEPDVSPNPWNPEQIRVSTKQFSLRNVMDMIQDESLELAPDFQRGKVWKATQKSRLIESVLLQIPLPAFYFAEDADGTMKVVDGLQRLSTIHGFVRGPADEAFPLKDLEYLVQENGHTFDDLAAPWKRRINNAQIIAHVIDPTTPSDVKYDIFKRINTGGTPLNNQEIRHCMSKDRSRSVLREMTGTEEFDEATNGLGGHTRMQDREMALRFAAFWLQSVDSYLNRPGMDAFLESATRLLDSPDEVPDNKVKELKEAFRKAMRNCHLVFGPHAFRKWPIDSEHRKPINRALFETWSLTLAGYEYDDLRQRRTCITNEARERMTDDFEYLDAITSSTGDRERVRYRFLVTEEAAGAGL
ncbi:DUF262 domain-containing protein [Nocardiopsis synnemataformans]|uniref:DUF262 domain-containing protein n=1 Tax=Nocardiopsis synnemataformans TaxID=61305 RepID=UPI003EBE2CC7